MYRRLSMRCGRLGGMTSTQLPIAPTELVACCTPASEVISAEDAEQLARRFKALADPTRVRLLSLIANEQDSEACICYLTHPVGLSQPTVSHHMKQLVEAGLVTREQRGKWAYYRLANDALAALAAAITPAA
jgi:ArsR family transcriptional regulator